MEIFSIPASIATILAALIAGLLLFCVHRHNAFRAASIEFKAAFVNELAILNAPVGQKPGTVYDALLSAFDKHQRAVIAIQGFLPCYKKDGFKKAWDAYCKHSANFSERWPDYEKMNHLCEYLAINDEEERNVKALAIKRLNKLLSYANAR